MHNVRVAEHALCRYTFANGWVSPPPSLSSAPMTALEHMPVSGRGRTREDAINVMMMEAVERNSAMHAGNEKLMPGKAGDLSPAMWRTLLPFSNRQLASRKNVPLDHPEWIGPSLSNKTRLQFADAISLLDGQSKPVPAAFVYLGYAAPGEPDYAHADSNGCAAAESKEDASLRALLELVERDALGIWWFNQLERGELTFQEDEELTNLAQALASEHRTLRLIDLTHDLHIPVVAAVNADEGGERIYLGCAAGLSETEAAHRAALEAFGFWFWGKISTDPPSRMLWLEQGSLERQPFLKPQVGRPLSQQGRHADLRGVVHTLQAAGIEPLVVDLTRPYFNIPVVRVIAPGLRSHLPRFSPGRLYDVPLTMGWLHAPRSEDELLAHHCPL